MAKKEKRIPNQQPLQKDSIKGVNTEHKTKKSWSPITKTALFLGIVAFCMYANTLQNGYALDDESAIHKNAVVRQGIKAIPQILSTPYHYGNFRVRENGPSIDDLYRPLSLVMFAIEFQLWGENPAGGHFINILLYAGCVMLLFLFLHYLFREKRPVLAFITSLLFALHPIHTEIVANIKSRDELLCFFFAFLTLISFLKYLKTNNKRLLIIGLLFYFLSLLSKETSITFLAVIAMVFFFYQGDNRKRSFYIFFLSLLPVAIYLVIRFSVLIAYHSYNPTNIPFIENVLTKAPSFASRLATATLVLGYYIKLLIVPYPLISDYSFNSIPYANFSNVWVLLSLCCYLFLAFFGVFRLIKKSNDPLAFGILFFLITISIFSNILFLLASEMAERFMFFPSVGICLAIAFIMEQWLFKPGTTSITGLLTNKIALIVLMPICIIYIFITKNRNEEWKDSYTLFLSDSKKSPDNSRLYYFAGNAQIAVADDEETPPAIKQQMLHDGILNFQKCLSIYPGYADAQASLSDAFMVINELDSAEVYGKKAISFIPYDTKALNTLATVYIAKQRYTEAIQLCQRATAINPGNPNYLGNIGVCYIFMKQYDSAINYFRKAITVDPLNTRSVKFIAAAFNAVGQPDSTRKYESIVKQTEPAFSVKSIPLPR